MSTNRTSVSGSRDGIALVVVLGFLVILVLLGVSFSVMMRTERLASRNYADSVRAKHLLRVALTRCMYDIDQDLRSASLLAPDWDYFESISPGGNLVTNGLLVSGSVTGMVPTVLLEEATNISKLVEWREISDPEEGGTIGRIAYLAIDCSGFIDINAVLPTQPRTNGASPREVDLDEISELESASFTALSDRFRDEYRRFETFEDLVARMDEDNLMGFPISNFFVYSYSPPVSRWDSGVVTEKVDLDTASAAEIRAQLEFALTNAPDPVADSVGVWNNYQDYVDSDFEPTPPGPDSFSTEPVPMINEIVVSNFVEETPDGSGGTLYNHKAYLVFETWFPFPRPISPPSDPFPAFEIELLSDPAFTVLPATVPPPSTRVTMGPQPIQNVLDYSFQRTEFIYESGPQAVDPRSLPFAMRCEMQGAEVLAVGGGAVDRVPPLRFQFVGLNKQGQSVSDPRINWDANDWYEPGITLTISPNSGTNDIRVADVGEGIQPLFVRNGLPETVWELGFLSIGQPWETIRLYDNSVGKLHPILDAFEVSGSSATGLFRGRLNLNSTFPETIAAGLYRAPGVVSPLASLASPLSQLNWASAEALGENLTQRFLNRTNLFNVSELGAADWAAFGGTLSDPEIESMIGNSASLFTVRQNLFLVVLAAQALSEAAGDTDSPGGASIEPEEVVAEQRAVALFWRDPYPETHADYEYPFVRFFKYLD